LDTNLEKDSGYGLLLAQYKSDLADAQESNTGRSLLGVPSRGLPNGALERLAARIVKVLAGAVKKAPGLILVQYYVFFSF
jgi:hypothetical protein